MKALIFSIIVIVFISFFSNLHSQSGWVKQNSSTIQPLNGLYFLNDNIGWTVGDSAVICKTTNGGTNWIKSTYSGGGTLVSLYFWDEMYGIIGGYNDTISHGFTILTTDGGSTWFRTNFWYVPFDITSKGGDTAWFTIRQGIQLSYDRGVSWNLGSEFGSTNLVLRSIYFINSRTGWACGSVIGGQAFVYKTTSGGLFWWNQLNTIGSGIFYGIAPVDKQTIFVCSQSGDIYKTINGGDIWDLSLSGISSPLYGIDFPIIDTGYVCGGNTLIMKTANSGAEWNTQILPPEVLPGTAFYKIKFRSASLGWAIGDNGTILKTTNGGEPLGIKPIGNTVPESYHLYQNYPNPFNPTTTIEFDIPKTSFTKLSLYDINGKEILTLVSENLNTGRYRVNLNAQYLSSGIYIYKLISGNFTEARKLVLMK